MALFLIARSLPLRLRALASQNQINFLQPRRFTYGPSPTRLYSNAPTPTSENLEPDKTNENEDLFGEEPMDDSTARLKEPSSEPAYSSGSKVANLEPDTADEAEEFEADEELDATRTKYMSRGKLMAAHRSRVIPELREEDLDETFVRGSGPGGQAINKTSSSVSLIHRPTGIRVQCQATRSREQNRKIARKIMLERLDQIANPGLSKLEVQQEKVRARKRQKAKKARKKAKLKGELADEYPEGSA